MNRKLFKYIAITKINMQSRAAYLANIIARSGAVTIRIWLFSQLYLASYQTSGSSVINGLPVTMAIWIVVLVQCFRAATRPHVSEIIDEAVKSGSLAYNITKPYSFILFHYFSFLGRAFPAVVSNLLVGILVTTALVGVIKPSVSGILWGILLLFLGYTLDFLINFIIGISAFWVEDIGAADWIYQHIQYIFGGVVIPIMLFPEKLAPIVSLLPFTSLYYSAAQTIVAFQWHTVANFLAIQFCWIVICSAGAFFLFRRGIRNVSLNGG